MKTRVILVLIVLLSLPAAAADFNDFVNGNWNADAMNTWGEGVGTFPGASDDVTIDSHSITVTADAEANDLFIFKPGTVLTVF